MKIYFYLLLSWVYSQDCINLPKVMPSIHWFTNVNHSFIPEEEKSWSRWVYITFIASFSLEIIYTFPSMFIDEMIYIFSYLCCPCRNFTNKIIICSYIELRCIFLIFNFLGGFMRGTILLVLSRWGDGCVNYLDLSSNSTIYAY